MKSEIEKRIRAYLSVCAPHVKEREGHKLLRKAADALAAQQGRVEVSDEKIKEICRDWANRIDQIARQRHSTNDYELEIRYAIKTAFDAAHLAQARESAAQEISKPHPPCTGGTEPASAAPAGDDLELPKEPPARWEDKDAGGKGWTVTVVPAWTYDDLLSLARKLKQRLAIMTTLKLPAAQEVKIKEATSTEASVGAFPLDASPPVSAATADDLALLEEPERYLACGNLPILNPDKKTVSRLSLQLDDDAELAVVLANAYDTLLSLARKLKERLAIMTTLKLPAGGQCAECGFRYWEYKGHIIPCPLCRLAEAERQLKEKP